MGLAARVPWLLDPRFLSPLGTWGRSGGWFLFAAGEQQLPGETSTPALPAGHAVFVSLVLLLNIY